MVYSVALRTLRPRSRCSQLDSREIFQSTLSVCVHRFKRFLPRDAMHKRGLCCHAVSVCLSVTFVDHVKTNKHIFKIFVPLGSPTILVFSYRMGWRYSDGNPPSGAGECRCGSKKRDSGRIFGLAAYRSSVVNPTSREV